MEIDSFTFRGFDVEPHLDVWEHELDRGHPAGGFVFFCPAIRLNREIVCDAKRFHHGPCGLNRGEIRRSITVELIAQKRAWSV
jgi:hypothetical protein